MLSNLTEVDVPSRRPHFSEEEDMGNTTILEGFWSLVAAVNWILVVPLMILLLRQSLLSGQRGHGPPGFSNAPISKACILVIGALSTFASLVNGGGHGLTLATWWRMGIASLLYELVTYQFYFTNIWFAAVGCLLLYEFRQFERMWGPSKVHCPSFLPPEENPICFILETRHPLEIFLPACMVARTFDAPALRLRLQSGMAPHFRAPVVCSSGHSSPSSWLSAPAWGWR